MVFDPSLSRPLFVTCPRGLEDRLADELNALGATRVSPTRAGVAARGDLEVGYRICLHSRIGTRVLWEISKFKVKNEESLYLAAQSVPWEQHMRTDGTFAVDATLLNSKLRHSKYCSLKVKDGIADYFRQAKGRRPDVDPKRPDMRVHVFVTQEEGTLNIDLSGDSLHRRGYRIRSTDAPIKEVVAAGMLIRAGWDKWDLTPNTRLIDPMCGSGTLLIEGAMMSANIAPGLVRRHWGFSGWLPHQPGQWRAIVEEAKVQANEGIERLLELGFKVEGLDIDERSVQAAEANIEAVGLGRLISVKRGDVREFTPEEGTDGLIVSNPPYGERLGQIATLRPFYRQLGEALRRAPTYQATLVMGEEGLARTTGLRAHKKQLVDNGPIKCELLHFDLSEQPEKTTGEISSGAQQFRDRLTKNLKRWKKWADKNGIEAYRVYDRDLPDYAFSIDVYGEHYHIQEYRAPTTVDPRKAQKRHDEALDVVTMVTGCNPANIHVKLRERQKGNQQYERQGEQGRRFIVKEGPCKFFINLDDYLDSGLFLDHRPIRLKLGEWSDKKRFLNLYAYTGTASVHAILGGADMSVTVDTSNTYLKWAKENFRLNEINDPMHSIERSDSMEYLETTDDEFDIIFVDPPTFSNRKAAEDAFDLQRDHVALLKLCAKRLAPDGKIVFSNNFRRFELAESELTSLSIEEISEQTIPEDFGRQKRIHRCWIMTHQA